MLTKPQAAFLKKIGYEGISFPMTADNLLNAEILSEKAKCSDKLLAEKILNLPAERQEELIEAYWIRPQIDLLLAANKSLNNAQFNEHLRIAHYNYEAEYGDLKDSGRMAIDKQLISDIRLNANQLFMLACATSEGLKPELLIDEHHHALPESEMHDMLNKMRMNAQTAKLIDTEASIRILPLATGDVLLNQPAKEVVTNFLNGELALKKTINEWEQSLGNSSKRSELSIQTNMLRAELQKIAQAAKPVLNESLPVTLSFIEQRKFASQSNLKMLYEHLNKGGNTISMNDYKQLVSAMNTRAANISITQSLSQSNGIKR